MYTQMKTHFLFYTFALFMCLSSFFLSNAAAQDNTEPITAPASANYTFERINVPGVDYLSVTASSDFQGYAGYTKSADGQKHVAFTLIHGVFTTYDVPGSRNTYFYAFGNDGTAAGHYQDSEGLYHGVILKNGELRRYDFPGAVETQIYGYSDSTGALTGNFIDASGVRRGFSGETIIEAPGALATYADFVSGLGNVVGSYVDAEGLFHPYWRLPNGGFHSIAPPSTAALEYLFVHGVNDANVMVLRIKLTGDVARTYVGDFRSGLSELQVPDSVGTEGWNINPDGSVVGHYDTADGRRRGFIARPTQNTAAQAENQPVIEPGNFNYTFESIDVPGVDFLAVTASSDFEDFAGYTRSADGEKEVGFTLIDGVFTTYDFPGSQKTHFYAFGNNGVAAGHYQDSEGLYHGVILENGELRQYDFPGAVETQIYGISDATGALTGNFTNADGIRRGFSGDTIVEVPGATATYADFVNAAGLVVGSYVDVEGIFHPYIRTPEGRHVPVDFPHVGNLEYFFLHGINDVGTLVGRTKRAGDVPRTTVGSFQRGLQALEFPGSVSTEGWNVNQDGSVVGYYDAADGHRYGFIARPAAQVDDEHIDAHADDTIQHVDIPDIAFFELAAGSDFNYTFESIEVPGVQFLELTSSNDFDHYAGNTRSPDGEKMVGFTLIDDVFTTYDFPGAKNTYFYALGNTGIAAGYYEDSDGLHHGVVLEDGELRQSDFPGAVETFIHGISDATGALTGNFIDASGVRRGFSGETIIEVPGASETYADFINAIGLIVGSYVDSEGLYHAYQHLVPSGQIVSLNFPHPESIEYLFVHGVNQAYIFVIRFKRVGDIPRTYVGGNSGLYEFRFPGSVSTEGWNINPDGSVVGYYDTADGRRHGFIARPTADTAARVSGAPVDAPAPSGATYTFESIDVPGVDFLELTASSDFQDYAGYTRGADGQKTVGFTLIDGVFTTYDYPGSQGTYFYALGNDGTAAGHYQDSEGLFHGVVLEDGELREYNFPGAVETEIYGISDATGALTGNFTDASGIRRGFTGDIIVAFPGAAETYTDFVNAHGSIVGSYVDAHGRYEAYVRTSDGRFLSFRFTILADLNFTESRELEYVFLHGISDAGVIVARSKAVDGIPRTYVGATEGLHELRFPGSVSTQGWNINQDGSVVGHYDSPDGRRHGFIARLADAAESQHFGNTYTVTLSKGLNMLSVPLAPPTPMTAKNLVAMTGATAIIMLDAPHQRFIAWTPDAPNDGFSIEGGQGYIVNVPQARNFAFVGAPWTDPTEETAASPAAISTQRLPQEAWAFVVSGHLEGKPAFDGYQVIVWNLRTNRSITASVQGDYFAAATADLRRRSVVKAGDVIEVRVIGPDGNVESQTLRFKVMPEHLANAVLSVRFDSIGQPTQNLLLQNYPNPFNPETWIPYQLAEDSPVSIAIYDTAGQLVRTLSLGFQSAGFYNSQGRAAYWDGRNALGERVASGLYFYQLTTPSFQQTRRLVIVK